MQKNIRIVRLCPVQGMPELLDGEGEKASCKPIEDNNGLWSLRSHPQIDVNKVDLLICVS